MNKTKQTPKLAYKIPKSFTVAGVPHTIDVEELLVVGEDNVYGYYQPAKQEIKLARNISGKELTEVIQLSDELILNTFGHELAHVFQFYLGDDFSEAQAQTLGNLLSEFLKTSK